MSEPTEPKLAAPGAGLPWPERLIASFMVKHGIRRTSRQDVSTFLATECQSILDLVTPLPPEKASRRVLIQRLRGLEDSSRYWSVLMTLDHLRIVNNGIAEAITLLGQGEVPEREVSTATVKPVTEVDGSVVEEFAKSCEAIELAAKSLPDLKTTARYAHPWFGPFDAGGWYFMSAFHVRLHRKQIEAILARA